MYYSYLKDIGGREEQQDAVKIFHLNNQTFMVLADGMGGHQGGAIASSTLINIAEEYFLLNNSSVHNPKKFFNTIISKTKEVLKEIVNTKPIDPNTTVVFALIIDNILYYSYLGDSRLYLFEKESKLLFQTRDHSFPEMLYQDKQITEEEISTHPQQNILTKSIGFDSLDIAEYGEIKLKNHKEYIILLASDGLWSMLNIDELHRELFTERSLIISTKKILNLAKNRAGKEGDNISIAVFLKKRKKYTFKYKFGILIILSIILIYFLT